VKAAFHSASNELSNPVQGANAKYSNDLDRF